MPSKKKQAELREQKEWETVSHAVHSSENFLEKYQKPIFGVVVVIIVVALIVLAYKHFYVAPREQKAEVAMAQGEQYFNAGKDSLAVFGDGNGYVGFEALMKKYSSTPSASLAKLYAGISYAHLGQYQKAVDYLKSYSGNDAILSKVAKGTMGDCLENLGKSQEAVTYLVEAAKDLDSQLYSPIFYKKAGLIYRELKQYDKMVEVFTTIKNRYAASPQAMEAEKYILEGKTLMGSAK